MKIFFTSLLLILFIFGITVAAHAQGIEWKTLNDEVDSLGKQGFYDRAVVVAKKALQIAEQALGPDHPDVAQSLNRLAMLYDNQGQYALEEGCKKTAGFL